MKIFALASLVGVLSAQTVKQEEEKIDGEKAEEYTREAKEHYYDALA